MVNVVFAAVILYARPAAATEQSVMTARTNVLPAVPSPNNRQVRTSLRPEATILPPRSRRMQIATLVKATGCVHIAVVPIFVKTITVFQGRYIAVPVSVQVIAAAAAARVILLGLTKTVLRVLTAHVEVAADQVIRYAPPAAVQVYATTACMVAVPPAAVYKPRLS